MHANGTDVVQVKGEVLMNESETGSPVWPKCGRCGLSELSCCLAQLPWMLQTTCEQREGRLRIVDY